MNPRTLRLLAFASLVAMAMLWGSTFFSIKALVAQVPVADMLAVRFLVASVVLGLIGHRHWRMSRQTLVQGVWLGVIFGSAQLVQTFGLARTAASVSGFITGLYVVATPFLAAVLLRERITTPTWFGVLLATLGLGVLTLDPSTGLRIGTGELLTLACAVLYAGHIVGADRWSNLDNALSLTLVQTPVTALICLVAALPGGITLPATGAQWGWLLYLAIACGALTIFLQMWAQSQVESTTAAVVMAAEPVWAAVFAVTSGQEDVKWQMLVGGAAMFTAMVLVILAPRWKPAHQLGAAGA